MLDQINASLTLLIQQSQLNAYYLGVLLLIMFGFFVASRIFPPILALGIWPRRTRGLLGIIFAPFLHLNFNHLFFNCIPLVVLSDFILINGLPHYLWVSFYITIISGFLVWCFAKPGIHLGASGVITGYWGFLVANVYQQESIMSVILGVICFYYFAGIFLGIFPREKGVSWEGHLFGLIAGITTSFIII